MRDQWDASDGQQQRFLRPESREIRRRSRPWAMPRVGRGALRVLLGVTIVAGALGARHLLLHTPKLAIRKVTFDGDRRTSAELLARVGSAVRGKNVLALDLGVVEARLRRDAPWVKDVTIRRIPPHGIDVVLVEHEPIARLAGGLHLLGEDGRLLPADPVEPGDDGLPLVAGTQRTTAGSSELAAVVELLGYLRAGTSPLAARLVHVDASDPEDLVLRLADASFDVHLGNAEFVSRLNRFLNVEPVLRARYADLERVDLRFRGRVVVAPVERGPQSSPSSGG